MEENDNIKFTCLNKCVSVIGMRGSGKSEMMRYIVMAEQHKFYKVFVISPTHATNNFYNFISKENIFNEWSDEWIESLLLALKNINKNKQSQKITQKTYF